MTNTSHGSLPAHRRRHRYCNGNAGWDTETFSAQLDRCAPSGRLLLQTTVVEQDGGKGAYASVPISAFSAWLRLQADAPVTADAAEEGGVGAQGAMGDAASVSPSPPDYYLSEMDDIDELCPALLPDMSFLQPFDAILPWGSFIPPPIVDTIAWLSGGGWDVSEWSGLYAPLYPVLWWGPRRTRTGLHYDIERYNILAQIRGSKNVVSALLSTCPPACLPACLPMRLPCSKARPTAG